MANGSVDPISILVGDGDAGKRLDLLVSERLPTYSRSFIKRLVDDGLLSINGQLVAKAGIIVKANDLIAISFPPPPQISNSDQVLSMGVELVYEHADFLIISKPAGLVVHAPGDNYQHPTLVDWLLQKFSEIAEVGDVLYRPGIVHRLDLQTSGLMIIPRNNQALAIFGDMFRNRTIHKTYLAVVMGHPSPQGLIDYHIVRHPTHRNKMAHVKQGQLSKSWAKTARTAQTHYRVLKYLEKTALVEAKPVTGRTHQIRVHFASIGHGLIGDALYGHQSNLISRQALHAHQLEFNYLGTDYVFKIDPPADIRKLYS